jgi:hypothetical protein
MIFATRFKVLAKPNFEENLFYPPLPTPPGPFLTPSIRYIAQTISSIFFCFVCFRDIPKSTPTRFYAKTKFAMGKFDFGFCVFWLDD